MISLSEAVEILKNHDKFNILIHAFPDGDTIGSGFALCYALRAIGKKANVVSNDAISHTYDFLLKDYKEQEFEVETYISTDVADLKLLGKNHEFYDGKIILAIDHHATNKNFAQNLLLDAGASSACEIVLQVIEKMGVPITKTIAECIYTGLSTDTGCFKYSNTTPFTHRVAAQMMEIGIDFDEINRIMFDTKTRKRLVMERMILDTIAYYYGGRMSVIVITNEMIKKSGASDSELEGITSLPRQIEGVKIGVTLREKEDGCFKISVRTHTPIDAAEICSKFGGGGHVRAAGCSVEGNPEEIKQQFVDVCKGYFE